MRILLTGATGFIGRHVAREILQTNHDIMASALELRPSVSDFFSSNRITYVPCDMNERRSDYSELFGNPDAVIHLSWEGLPHYKELFHFERNLPSNYHFLKNLIESGVRDVTVIGTCLEYGIRNGSLSEDMKTEPVIPYALAKDSLRRFLEELRKIIDFRFRWIRLFYTYGEGQNENSLLEQLKKAIVRGDKTFDMSRGDQIRDYLSVEKVAHHVVKIALQRKAQGIINCCSGEPISIRTFVESYLKSTGGHIALNLGAYAYPDYEPLAFWGDTSKLNSILDDKG